MLQNATPLRKSAPWPPNISDEHVSCIAPAMRNASFRPLFKCSTPAIGFETATKPSRFFHFWQGAQSLAPATQNDLWTSKSAPYPTVFCTFDFEMCFAPQRRALFRHRNFQKCSEPVRFFVLRATTACTFSTSQLPKVVRAWCVLYILTSKCASRHNGVQFVIPHLASWLRTRRFSELLFDPPEPQIIGKTQWIATFLPFRAPGSSFFWDFLFFDRLSSSLLFSDSSHLCFSSVHIVGSLTSKLRSIIHNIYIYIYIYYIYIYTDIRPGHIRFEWIWSNHVLTILSHCEVLPWILRICVVSPVPKYQRPTGLPTLGKLFLEMLTWYVSVLCTKKNSESASTEHKVCLRIRCDHSAHLAINHDLGCRML